MLRYLLFILSIVISAGSVTAQQSCSSACTGTLGENIFPNGDFGTGVPNILPINPNLAPGYIYQPNPPPNDGYYCITNNTSPWGWFANTFWINIPDNGPEDNGYMMVVNASYQPGLFYEKTVDVCDNTLYELSIDVINLFGNQFQGFILPNISFLIDGVVACETGDIQQDETWHTVRFSFVSGPSQGTVTLALRNNAPGGGGNDLAIDNISFRACGPSITVPQNFRFCDGTAITIPSVLENAPYTNTVYQWQIFTNGIWEDIPNATNASLELPNPVDGSLVRLMVGSQVSNLSLPNCRVVSAPILLEEIPGLIVNTSVEDISCATAATAIAVVDTSSGTAPFTYTWSSGQSNAAITNLSTGTFQVTVTDANGCTGLGAVTVSAPPGLSASANATDLTCFGNTDASAIASVSGGLAPFSFLWSNGDTTANLSNLPAGTYQLTVTDANACSGLAVVAITEPPPLAASATATDVSCFAGNDASAIASITGGVAPYSYLWDNGQITASINNLTAGSYLVTVTDGNACTEIAAVAVAEPPALTANATATDVPCFGGAAATAMASVAGGVAPYSYAWSNGQTAANISNLPAGAYLVTVTDANACTNQVSVTVNEPPILETTTAVTTVSCFGGSDAAAVISVAGGVAPYNYAWSNGQSTANITDLSAGDYLITVTDANACTWLASATVTAPPALTASTTVIDVSCFGGNNASVFTSAVGGVAPYSYEWSNGETSANISSLSTGAYQVTVTDANTCTELLSVTVTEPPILTASASAVDASCFGSENGFVLASVAGGVPPYSYKWSNGQTVANISSLSSGTYQVTVTDANSCSSFLSVTVNEPPVLTANATTIDVSCFGGNNAAVVASVTGGIAPYSYNWSNGQNTGSISNLSAGSYQITVTDANTCTEQLSVTVAEPPVLTASAIAIDVSCFGGNDASASAMAAGGVSPYSYSWSNGQSTASIANLTADTYQVTVTDANACTGLISVAPTEPPALIASINQTDVSCFGAQDAAIKVSVAGGVTPYSYLWSNGLTAGSITNLTGGTYSVTIKDDNGCYWTTSTQVYEPPLLSALSDGTEISCHGMADGTLVAFASGGIAPYEFHWSNGETSPEIVGLAAGAYTVNIIDAIGCSVQASEYLVNPTAPTVDLGSDLVVNLGDVIDLEAVVNLAQSAIMDYTWSGSTDSLHCADCYTYSFQPIKAGCQRVLVRSKRGCIAIDTVCYEVRRQRHIYAPNIFSPNEDGENDFFTLFSDDSVEEMLSLSIYNRWGGHLFLAQHIHTNDERAGWDGTFKGLPMNPDVFVWMAEVLFIDGTKILLSGDVTLLR